VSRIFWDTNLFIYLIEDHGDLSERVAQLRKRMIERRDDLYTSALTLGEILVKPIEAGDDVLGRRYEAALRQGASIIPFDVEAARLYAHSQGSHDPPTGCHSAGMCRPGARRPIYYE